MEDVLASLDGDARPKVRGDHSGRDHIDPDGGQLDRPAPA
jgi:hypothetical protein